MRFFSNDARESTDDQAADDRSPDDRSPDDRAHDEQAADHQGADHQGEARSHDDERPDRVQSDPVAVPSQRPGSPWSNTPPVAGADAATGRDDTDPPPFHEPGPQPTAFGASTVGGAVAASATANPVDDQWDRTDRTRAADDDPADGVVTSSTTTYAGDTADRQPDSAPDTIPATWAEHDTRDERDRTEPDGVVDVPLDDDDAPPTARSGAFDTDRDTNQDDSVTTFDDPGKAQPGTDAGKDDAQTGALKDDGTFDDPKVTNSTATDSPATGSAAVGSDDDSHKDDGPLKDDDSVKDDGTLKNDSPLKDDGGFDDPKVVDPVTEAPLAADSTPDDSADDSADDSPSDNTPPAVVAAPVPVAAAAAAPASAGPADKLFDQDDARSFQERWRDVQLRFVDSPKDAAGDAAELVDEAVEKLTASLRGQRAGLDNDTEDTEQLRVQLRGYREILNRILSL